MNREELNPFWNNPEEDGLCCAFDDGFDKGIECAEKWFHEHWREYINVDADGMIAFGHWKRDFREAMKTEPKKSISEAELEDKAYAASTSFIGFDNDYQHDRDMFGVGYKTGYKDGNEN